MELTQHGFLEELLAPRKDNWSSFSTGLNDQFLSSGWSFDSYEENPVLAISNPPFLGFSTPAEANSECPLFDQAYPFVDHGAVLMPELQSSYTKISHHEDYPSMIEDEDQFGFLGCENQSSALEESKTSSCKVELMEQSSAEMVVPAFNMGLCSSISGEKKSTRPKKLEGQPSKNLMAERRRRKRLNDRLSMLRSIVPKISKMDRTSILGDTIDYMKELLERISKLQEEGIEDGTNKMINLLGISKELKPSEVLVRNSPKFDVERREIDTRIDICCAAKPGLLLSTVNTLESLGLEIQQCVISCFNDFSMQASCSEGAQQRTLINSEDIKQAIFRNAGYGGRCL
ncbi:Basic helix-loop-helix transcription factor [Trema orientale]|uniref:Basic helix-loop-helix transcription factor n=1 Tax=Trema orientale TaxID=63057 RepID=A0A2P5FH73_TREOI|nr:Basic helix-loop-helix transcription factor [Trema orientale]